MIPFEEFPNDHKWSTFLGHIPIRVFIKSTGNGYADIGRMSHGVVKSLQQVRNTNQTACILRVGDFCEFAGTSRILIAGEHGKNDLDRFTLNYSPVFRSLLQRGEFTGQSYSNGPITIGTGTIISSQSLVLSGVSIGSGCLIGAGAVVVKNIPDQAIAVGVPAKKVKNNSISLETIKKLETATLFDIAKEIYRLEVPKLRASFNPKKRLVVSVNRATDLWSFNEVSFIGVQADAELIPIRYFPKLVSYSKQILKNEKNYEWEPNPLELDQL